MCLHDLGEAILEELGKGASHILPSKKKINPNKEQHGHSGATKYTSDHKHLHKT